MKYKFPIVEVIWDDAESEVNWTNEPNVPLEPTLMMSIGFLIRDETNYILIADTYQLQKNSNCIGNTIKIPRGMIKTISPIKIAKPRKPKSSQSTLPSE